MSPSVPSSSAQGRPSSERSPSLALVLGVFFGVGGMLFGIKTAWRASQTNAPLVLRIDVKAGASPLEVERAIDEAVLLDLAVSSGGALVDPVVREMLLLSMRRVSTGVEARDDGTLLERAIQLGLHRTDPVVRQRLAFQSQQVLMASATSEVPSDAALEAYLATHHERYTAKATLSFVQTFVDPARHAPDPRAYYATLQRRLSPETLGDAVRLSDPTLLPPRLVDANERLIDGRFGAGFFARLLQLELRQFVGPIPSSYGMHFVCLLERRPAELPPLSIVRPQVLADYRHDQREQLYRARLKALRAQRRVNLHRLPP